MCTSDRPGSHDSPQHAPRLWHRQSASHKGGHGSKRGWPGHRGDVQQGDVLGADECKLPHSLDATQSSEVIYRQVKGLFNVLKIEKSIRLIGVGASGLMPAGTPVQTGLFEDFEEKDADWEKVDRTIDRISEKFGKGFIQVGPLSEKT